MVTPLYDQIVRERGSLGNLVARIPGFRGYQDNRDRRTADRQLRDYIANQLQQRVTRLAGLERQLLSGGGLQHMSETAAAKSRLQTYTDTVKTAAPGYSGFFDAEKLGPDEYERLYAFDEAQMRYLAQIDGKLDALQEAITGGGDSAAAIQGLYDLAGEAHQAFLLREDVLKNLDITYSAK